MTIVRNIIDNNSESSGVQLRFGVCLLVRARKNLFRLIGAQLSTEHSGYTLLTYRCRSEKQVYYFFM